MGKYLWMAVEADEYELPLAVCDTAQQLGELYGLDKNKIYNNIRKNCSGRICGRRYIKVEIDEEDT